MLVCTVVLCSSRSANPIRSDGTYKGRKLMGEVVVEPYNATFRVYVTNKYDADLHVKVMANGIARRVGEWVLVPNGLGDFSVTFVNSRARADFTIYIVGDNPGVNQ